MRVRMTVLLLLCGLAILGGPGCSKRVNNRHPSLDVTTRVSLRTDGGQGIGASSIERPGISGDGRFVAYTSKAPNLVANDSNNVADVFYWDNIARTTVCVSVTLGGVPGDAASGSPSISDDGRYVCFVSRATNINADSPDLPTQRQHVYIRDMTTGITTLVDRGPGPGGQKANQDSANPEISKDGNWVVFESAANNLDNAPVGGPDDDALVDVYRRRVIDNTNIFPTEIVSAASDQFGGAKANGDSGGATISADGMRIAFQSVATNLIPDDDVFGPDNAATPDVFYREMINPIPVGGYHTIRVSVAHPSAVNFPHPDGSSLAPSISANGRYVAFVSLATNIDPADDGPLNDIFVRDILTATTLIISVHSSGAQAGNGCNFPRISGDGRLVTWQSPSPSLVNGDANGPTTEDIFLHDNQTGLTTRASIATYDSELNGKSLRPNISTDGRYVAFYTEATNAADDDSNGTSDFYMRGPPF